MTQTAPSLEPAYRFLDGELPVADFEQWVYSTPDLEASWGPKVYLELVSIDFRSTWAEHEARKVLDTVIDFAAFELWRLVPLLSAIVAGGVKGHAALAATYDEYCDDYYFLDNLAFGWGLTEQDTLTSAAARQADWKPPPAAIDEAKRALEWLRTGDVVLTGERDDLDRLCYEDHRPEAERQPRTYKRGRSA